MQHMTHISALGGTVDRILSDSDTIVSLSPDEVAAIGDINAYLSAYLEYTLQIKNNQDITSFITSPAAGYGWAKLIDTNSDPKDIKTLGTLLAGYLGGRVADVLVTRMINPEPESAKSVRTATNNLIALAKMNVAIADDAIKALTFLNERNLISDAQYATHAEAIKDELARAATIEKIEGFVNIASAIASGYHGFKRNGDNIAYGLAWALTRKTGLGVALAQGYAKPVN